jgi:WD40 repeat protein
LLDMTDPQRKRLWRAGTPGLVYSLAFAPDGKALAATATLKNGKALILWDVTDPAQAKRRALLEGCGPAAFAPDGKTLACLAGKDPSEVRLYDLTAQTPKQKGVLPLKAGGKQVAFLPNGRLVTATADKTLSLWDVSGSQPVETATVQTETPEPHRLAVAAAGHHLASLQGNSGIIIWSTSGDRLDQRLVLSLDGEGSNLTAFTFSPDGRTLYTGSLNGAVRAWDVSGKQAKEKTPVRMDHSFMHSRLLPSPNGRLLDCNSSDERLRLWDLAGTAPKEIPFPGEPAGRTPLAFTPDSRRLIDSRGRLWALAADKDPELLSAALPGATAATVSPDGKTLVLAEVNPPSIRLWDLDTLTPRQPPSLPWPPNENLALTPDNKTLIVGSGRGEPAIRIFSIDGPRPAERFQIKPEGIRSLAVAPDGQTLAIADSGNHVTFWGIAADQPQRQGQLEGLANVSVSIAYSPDGKGLARADHLGNVIVWDLERRFQRWSCKLPGAARRVAFAADGRHLLTLNGNGTIYVLRLATPDGKPYAPTKPAAAVPP